MFDKLARQVERWAGSPWAFGIAVALIVLWAVTGPLFDWSDSWQMVVNTGTTIVTFLMVFLIQATQSQDTKAIHVKLDELIRVSEARNEIILSEDVSREELDRMREQLQKEVR